MQTRTCSSFRCHRAVAKSWTASGLAVRRALVVAKHFWKMPTSSAEFGHTRGGTRTRNLLLRREAPYPLGHTSSGLFITIANDINVQVRAPAGFLIIGWLLRL